MSVKTNRPGIRILVLIMVGVLAWGVFHAIGAYSLNHNPWRAVVVLGFSMAFLVFWITLLLFQHQRPRSPSQGSGSKSNNFSGDEP